MSEKETENKKRNPNWNDDEIRLLVSKVEALNDILFGKLSEGKITKSMKDRAWDSIAHAINTQCRQDVKRSTEEVRIKWQNIKSNTKGKAVKAKRKARKTGGGESDASGENESMQTEREKRTSCPFINYSLKISDNKFAY